MDAEFRNILHRKIDNGIRPLKSEIPHLKARILIYETYIDKLRTAVSSALNIVNDYFYGDDDDEIKLEAALTHLEEVNSGE